MAMVRFSLMLILSLHTATAMKAYRKGEEEVLGGIMSFVNDNDECMQINLDLKYRNGARSMINDLIEGDCSSMGYEVHNGEVTAKLDKPYWYGKEPVPLTFKVMVPTERTRKKWEREEASIKAEEEKYQKEMEEEMSRMPAEAKIAFEKMQKGEELNAGDKTALEKMEKAELERLQTVQKEKKDDLDSFRQAKPLTPEQKQEKREKGKERSSRKRRNEANKRVKASAKSKKEKVKARAETASENKKERDGKKAAKA